MELTASCVSAWRVTQETNARRVIVAFKNVLYLVTIFFINSDIDECASSPCQNNGTCIDGFDGHACLCLAGYTGNVCEIGEWLYAI